MSDWDDDLFDELFKSMRKWMDDSSLFGFPARPHQTRSPPRSEEVIKYDDHVLLVMELGPQFSGANTTVELLSKGDRRILEIKSFENDFLRRYGLSRDMTGEYSWDIRNGIIEVVLKRQR